MSPPGSGAPGHGVPNQNPTDAQSMRTLRRIAAFQGCGNAFFDALMDEIDQGLLRPGARTSLAQLAIGRAIGNQSRPALALVVEVGTVYVQADNDVLEQCGPGSAFGLANVLAAASGTVPREPLGAETDAMLHSPAHGDGCRFLTFGTSALRRALAACPADRRRLQEFLHGIANGPDGTQQILNALQCNEALAAAVTASMTRHVGMPGELLTREGSSGLAGLVLLRHGSATLEIGGVQARHINEGMTFGLEMLLGVRQEWAVAARCATPCDLQLLHRGRLLSRVHELCRREEEDPETKAAQQLLNLLTGNWKQDAVTLSQPILSGYDPQFLSSLALALEFRVSLCGQRLWGESNGNREESLVVLLQGSCCEEDIAPGAPATPARESENRAKTVGRSSTRDLRLLFKPGHSCGEKSLLGLSGPGSSGKVVLAKTVCITAVLHRAVFLHALDRHPSEQHSPEVSRLLLQELSQEERALDKKGRHQLITSLPLFSGRDALFVAAICEQFASRFFMAGQLIGRAGVETKALLAVAQGEVFVNIADISIRCLRQGSSANAIALARGGHFVPCHDLVCSRDGPCEILQLTSSCFWETLADFPAEQCCLSGFVAEADGICEKDLMPPGLVTHFDIAKLSLFRGCSTALLRWLQRYMETVVFFPSEVIMEEGKQDQCLYIVCSGAVAIDGFHHGHRDGHKMSSGRGFVLGEEGILGVTELARATATASQLTVLQILHPQVLSRGLELYPGDAIHFNHMALARLLSNDMKRSATRGDGELDDPLCRVPLFAACGKDFRRELAELLCPRLVRKGEFLITEDAAHAGHSLCILHCGSAQSEELSPSMVGRELRSTSVTAATLKEHSAINAEVALGVAVEQRCAYRAEQACVVTEIAMPSFFAVLRRHPHELQVLLRSVVGQPWPHEAKQVPLFAETGQEIFRRLLDGSDWLAFLPDQRVVRQNGKGRVLFLLCYGIAVTKMDGHIVGDALAAGATVGAANFFGLQDTYQATVRAQSFCHFRAVSASHYQRLLDEFPAESFRFGLRRQKVQFETEEQSKLLHAQAALSKLRRRQWSSERRHVSTLRSIRGVAAGTASSDELLRPVAAQGLSKLGEKVQDVQTSTDSMSTMLDAVDCSNDIDPLPCGLDVANAEVKAVFGLDVASSKGAKTEKMSFRSWQNIQDLSPTLDDADIPFLWKALSRGTVHPVDSNGTKTSSPRSGATLRSARSLPIRTSPMTSPRSAHSLNKRRQASGDQHLGGSLTEYQCGTLPPLPHTNRIVVKEPVSGRKALMSEETERALRARFRALAAAPA